jgi:phage gp29-like protein
MIQTDTVETLAPPVGDNTPAPPEKGRLVTPDILFLNQGSTYRLGAAFSGTADPTTVWRQMNDDLPLAMMYYRELEEKDDDIGNAIAEVKLSVLKRGWQIQPGDDSQQAEDAAVFMRQQLDKLPDWRNSVDNMLDAPFYGHTIAELIFDTSMGQAGLIDIVDCPQELFCFAPYGYPQIGQIKLKQYMGASDGELVPESKFITFTSRSRHGNRMGRPLLRSIFWASWFKRNDLRFWLRLAERGPGTAVVKHADGANDSDRKKALQAAEALINDVAIAVPESFNVMTELLKSARSADPATYEKLYEKLDEKIYRRIVGGTLTSHGSSGGHGTQALGNVHQETKEERSLDLCLKAATVINRKLCQPLTLWNFGPDCPVPVFSFIIADEADKGEDVTTMDTLQGCGLDIPKKWAYSHFEIPVPEEGEEVLQRPAAPPPNIITPAGTPDKPQFSDAQQRQVDLDRDELDRLFGELRKDALRATGEQIGAIATSVEHSHRLVSK